MGPTYPDISKNRIGFLKDAYDEVGREFGSMISPEHFSVVKTVDDHRWCWRPDPVRTLLLAESHAYTTPEEHSNTMDYGRFPSLPDACPRNYVKFVYCLGYGESDLVPSDNSRTWQFWRVFVSCLHGDSQPDFGKVEKGVTKPFEMRLFNKISVLENLRKRGVWLMDASVMAIYSKNRANMSCKLKSQIINKCWKYHTANIIDAIRPERIIVIGKTVSESLEHELARLEKKDKIPVYFQYQPDYLYRTKSIYPERIAESYKLYHKICSQ